MQLLIFVPSVLIFLYCLYKIARDDYVLIRKNISLEQIFDIAFIAFIVSLVFARVLFMIFHSVYGKNILLTFFSLKNGGLSLTGAVLGGIVTLFIVAKTKKVPLGRLFDFFTLALLVTLPVGYLSYAAIFSHGTFFFQLIIALFYLLLTIFFMKFLYPRLMNRTIKEGNLTILFLIFFSLVSLVNTFLHHSKGKIVLLQTENVILVTLLALSLFLMIKQERSRFRTRRRAK